MTDTFFPAWIIAIGVLVICWPLAQALRHKELKPLAAYLLFTAVLGLVSGAVFLALLLLGTALLPAGAMDGWLAAAIVILLAFLPGLAAGRWIVRRPQVRRMPR